MKIELKHEHQERGMVYGPLFIDGNPVSTKKVKADANGFFPFDPSNKEPWFSKEQAKALAVAFDATFEIV